MKAVQINQYGGPEVLKINEIPKPSPGKDQVLVEVFSASINPFDAKFKAGIMNMPIKSPITLGGDFAGIITVLGEGVSDFTIGEQIYGQALSLTGASGAFAQFTTANTKNAAKKPTTADFVQAAALPLVGSSAIQALEEHIKLQSGQKILIHGGAGGIGHIAVQLAKAIGAYVTTTVSAEDKDFVKQLGADEILDYKTQKFEEELRDFDAVFDMVGGETTTRSFQVLKKGGVLVSMLGLPNEELAKEHDVSIIGQNTNTNTQHLNHLAQLVDSGKIKVNVDKIFPLDQVKDAFEYQENVHSKGKVILIIKE